MSDQREQPEEPGFAERESGEESPQTGGGVEPEDNQDEPADVEGD